MQLGRLPFLPRCCFLFGSIDDDLGDALEFGTDAQHTVNTSGFRLLAQR